MAQINGNSIGPFTSHDMSATFRNRFPQQAVPLCIGRINGSALRRTIRDRVWPRGWGQHVSAARLGVGDRLERSVFSSHTPRVPSYQFTEAEPGEDVQSIEPFLVTIENELVMLLV